MNGHKTGIQQRCYKQKHFHATSNELCKPKSPYSIPQSSNKRVFLNTIEECVCVYCKILEYLCSIDTKYVYTYINVILCILCFMAIPNKYIKFDRSKCIEKFLIIGISPRPLAVKACRKTFVCVISWLHMCGIPHMYFGYSFVGGRRAVIGRQLDL